MGITNNLGKLSNMITSTGSAVGIGTSSPSANLQLSGYTSGLPASSGSAQRGAFRIANSSNIGFDFGTVAAGQAWMQVSDVNNYASNFALLLNPNGGNVGIGTSSPTALGTGYTTLDVRGSSGGGINMGNATYSGYIYCDTEFRLQSSNSAITFLPSGSEKMRITSTGNVGIGTSSPSYKLDVSGTGRFTSGLISGANDAFVDFNRSAIDYANGLRLQTAGSNNWLIGNAGTNDLLFYNYSLGSAPLRITSGGNVGIGTSSPSYKLQVSGGGTYLIGGTSDSSGYTMIVQNSGFNNEFLVRNDGLVSFPSTAASWTTGNAANAWINPSGGDLYRSTSSIKYKKNVHNYTKGLAEVMQLRPVSYEGKGDIDSGKTFAGLIAEEVHELGLTEFVQYAEDGTPDALAYQNMIALAFKAIQELKAEIDELKNK